MHPNEPLLFSEATAEAQQPESSCTEEDNKFNYHVARLRFGLLDLNLRDSIKEGDGERLFLTLPLLLLFFHVYKRTKYSYVILLHLTKAMSTMSAGQAHELIWNRFFNKKGGAGHNIPLDLRMEHMVRLLKSSLKQLGANINEGGAQRIAQSLGHLEDLLQNASNDCQCKDPSGHHSKKPLQQSVLQIAKDLVSEECFEEIPGRQHKTFPKFKMNVLSPLNFTKYFSWISRLSKIWGAIYE